MFNKQDIKVTPANQEAPLSIHFLIIGAGIAGLSAAIGLRRVGHRVTVFERHPDVQQATGGCRLAPNMSKILFHWGLEEQARKIGMPSQGINFHILETGESLGQHIWDEEVIRETRGEFLFTHHSDLRQLLHDAAIHCGAQIHLGVTVTAVDPDGQSVQLSTGETVRGDVIIGADGVNGICRQMLTDEDLEPEHLKNLWSTVITTEDMERDPVLQPMIGGNTQQGMFGWFGHGTSALLFPLAGRDDYCFLVYAPPDGSEGTWEDKAPLAALQKLVLNSEPKVKRLAELTSNPLTCVPVVNYPQPDDWVHESGRLLIIGEAVHPLPPGCIQEAAMAVEDGAVLAKLFSHLRREDQIASFLCAFQDLRTPRCDFVLKKELNDVNFMTLMPGPYQEGRDAAMRAKRDAGVGALDSMTENSDDEELEEVPEWVEIKELFGYDAEDDADNWWMEWGRLRERARGTDVECGFVQPAEIAVSAIELH